MKPDEEGMPRDGSRRHGVAGEEVGKEGRAGVGFEVEIIGDRHDELRIMRHSPVHADEPFGSLEDGEMIGEEVGDASDFAHDEESRAFGDGAFFAVDEESSFESAEVEPDNFFGDIGIGSVGGEPGEEGETASGADMFVAEGGDIEVGGGERSLDGGEGGIDEEGFVDGGIALRQKRAAVEHAVIDGDALDGTGCGWGDPRIDDGEGKVVADRGDDDVFRKGAIEAIRQAFEFGFVVDLSLSFVKPFLDRLVTICN